MRRVSGGWRQMVQQVAGEDGGAGGVEVVAVGEVVLGDARGAGEGEPGAAAPGDEVDGGGGFGVRRGERDAEDADFDAPGGAGAEEVIQVAVAFLDGRTRAKAKLFGVALGVDPLFDIEVVGDQAPEDVGFDAVTAGVQDGEPGEDELAALIPGDEVVTPDAGEVLPVHVVGGEAGGVAGDVAQVKGAGADEDFIGEGAGVEEVAVESVVPVDDAGAIRDAEEDGGIGAAGVLEAGGEEVDIDGLAGEGVSEDEELVAGVGAEAFGDAGKLADVGEVTGEPGFDESDDGLEGEQAEQEEEDEAPLDRIRIENR